MNCPSVTYSRRPLLSSNTSSPPKLCATKDGISARQLRSAVTGGTSATRVSSTMGSTASTTATGRFVRTRPGTSNSSNTVSEEKILALPSLPNRMQRLSNTHSPSASVYRGVPVHTCSVTR